MKIIIEITEIVKTFFRTLERSVVRLRNKTDETQKLFDNYSLPYLAKKIEKISGEELSDMINKAKKKSK